MKNKIADISLIVIVVIIIILLGFYFIQNKLSNNFDNKTTIPNQTEQDKQTNDNQPQNKLVTNDFEINLPAGWQQTAPMTRVSAMAVNNNEKINDPAAQKINFKTYMAISYDTLQGKSLSEYLQNTKNQLQEAISDIVFAQEHDTTINNKTARAVEANLTQQGVNFKVLIVVIKGEGDDVWVISFNTLQSSWAEYQEIFSATANSFSLKK